MLLREGIFNSNFRIGKFRLLILDGIVSSLDLMYNSMH